MKAIIAALCLSIPIPSLASLTLTLIGTPGSPEISYTTSGSITLQEDVTADWSDPMDLGSSVSRLPVAGDWDDDYDNDLGEFLADFDSSLNDNLILSVPVRVFVNGEQMDGTAPDSGVRDVGVALYDTIDLDPDLGVEGGDDVELDNTSEIIYDALTAGDLVAWEEITGTFTLESGNFEDVFSNTGTFTNGNVFTLVIIDSSASQEVLITQFSVVQENKIELTVQASPERLYELQSSIDLESWNAVKSSTAETESLTFNHTVPADTERLFYRVVLGGEGG